MKKTTLLLFAGALSLSSQAQNFVEKVTTITGLSEGHTFFADVDNDNDLDIFITGKDYNSSNYSNTPMADLYLNDGNSNFTLSTQSFVGVANSDAAFGDLNGDGDIDLVVIGYDSSFNPTFNIYENDGSGVFTQSSYTSPFQAVHTGSIDLVDRDNDGDLDVFITGDINQYYGNGSLEPVAIFYTNNSNTSSLAFAADVTSSVATHYGSTVDFSDIDGDNDMDLIIYGYVGTYQSPEVLYSNTNGTYAQVAGSGNLNGMWNGGSLHFGDVNGDGMPDVVGTGTATFGGQSQSATSVQINNGSGVFSAISQTNTYKGAHGGGLSLGDVDNDGDLDYLLSGREAGTNNEFASIFLNDGSAHFTELTGTNFMGLYYGDAHLVDLNGDGKLDVVVTGEVMNTGAKTIKIYLQQACANTTTTTTITLNGNTLEAASSMSAYQWYKDNASISGATNQTYTPTASGDYFCEATDNGCILTSNTVSYTAVGIEDHTINLARIYPNPTKSILTIELNETINNITVYSISGQKMASFFNTKTINISNLESGVYFIKIELDTKEVITKRIVKQ